MSVWTEDQGLEEVPEPVRNITESLSQAMLERPVCSEDGCGKPCRKVKGKDEFHPWCPEHYRIHAGIQSTPKSRAGVNTLSVDSSKVAKKAEEQLTELLAMLQFERLASKDLYCAHNVGQLGPKVAKYGGLVAADWPMIAQTLEKSDKFAHLVMFIAVAGRLALSIGVHHDFVPYSGVVKFLVPPPPGSPAAVYMAQQQNGSTPESRAESAEPSSVG